MCTVPLVAVVDEDERYQGTGETQYHPTQWTWGDTNIDQYIKYKMLSKQSDKVRYNHCHILSQFRSTFNVCQCGFYHEVSVSQSAHMYTNKNV